MAKKKTEKKIREELMGAIIKTSKYPSSILMDGSPENIQLCEALGLDVFEKDPKADVSVSE